MLGFINLNKPKGLTSHDCVAKIRRLLKIKRVGHGGTLDPCATGVLPIAVGKATRLLQFLPTQKAYRARIRLGIKTTTDDLEGEIMATCPCPELSLETVNFQQFIGTIQQIPPMYSAIQQGGKRLYELARKGEKLDLPPRKVEIYQIEVLGWYPGEFPEIEVNIVCGAGTYIRSIARDLGEHLGVGGTLAALTRTESGAMKLSESLTLEEIENQEKQGSLALINPNIALSHLQAVTLVEEVAKSWCQGKKIAMPDSFALKHQNLLRVNHENGLFLGIGEVVNLKSAIGNPQSPDGEGHTIPNPASQIVLSMTFDRDNWLVPEVVLC